MTKPTFQDVRCAYAGFSSVHEYDTLFDLSRAPASRIWMTANRRSQSAEGVFDGIYAVERITLRMVVGDGPSDHVRAALYLQLADRRYVSVYAWEGVNLEPNHSTVLEALASNDLAPRRGKEPDPYNVVGSLDMRLRRPKEAIAVVLRLRGGRFLVQDLLCQGRFMGQNVPVGIAAYKNRSGYGHIWVAD